MEDFSRLLGTTSHSEPCRVKSLAGIADRGLTHRAISIAERRWMNWMIGTECQSPRAKVG